MDYFKNSFLLIMFTTVAVQTFTLYPYKTAAEEGFFKQLTSSFTEYKLIHCQFCQTDLIHFRYLFSGYWLKVLF